MSVFKVKSIVVKVGSLKFSIRDPKHDLLYKRFKALAIALVKKAFFFNQYASHDASIRQNWTRVPEGI
jgi:hypothetical protein